MLQLNHFMKQSMLFVLLVAFHREITLVNNAFMQVLSPEYLLAMKLHTARDDHDFDDPTALYKHVGYTMPQQEPELLAQSYQPSELLS